MKHRAIWFCAVGIAALSWFASGELRWPARLLTAMLLGPAPVAFILQAAAAERLPRPVPRIAIYTGSIIALSLLGVVSWLAARFSGFTPRTMGWMDVPLRTFVVWTVFALAAAACIVIAFRAAGLRESEIMQDIIPVAPAEKAVFVLLCIAAGVWEEIAFRSFLIPALNMATGSLAAGMVLSAAAFGLMHAHQKAAGTARAGLLGLILSVPLVLTGSIFMSITAHILVDLAGGLWLARWLHSEAV